MATLTRIPARLSADEPPRWYRASWADYLAACETAEREQPDHFQIFFNQGRLFIDMGSEGIEHARFRELLTMIIFAWFSRHPVDDFNCLGGSIIEKPEQRAASPDQVLYIGADCPRWRQGEARRINLRQWRVPDLVCEVGDTTIATDLDEKKQIYLGLEIPEYWVIDVRAARVLAFRLQAEGYYEQCEQSGALAGLAITLVAQTLQRLLRDGNGKTALWFNQQLAAS
ncbi:MAG: Uma2 family endonuclease [Spirulinaceae cyanobacterium RM2_2_10]|nr:Uma2 family endonuclease [Spirulinaceae cyanobacterium SM2_1_0]NJO19661.1 Uma2 family endonuclease [Spirulinaceae cyanobacterium RM2_2_10]